MPPLPSLPRALSRAALATLALVLLPATAQAASAPAGFRPFAPDSPWNLPLRADAPLHPRSAEWVRYLNASVATDGTWINSTSCGMPIYWADADTPRVAVKLASSAYQDPALIRAWSSVPIPAGATAANCADKNFAVMQRQPDGRIASWEFWSATRDSTGAWTARWGGASSDVQADRGIASSMTWTDPTAPAPALYKPSSGQSTFGWNVTATSISMYAGVITPEDLAKGSIDHAVALVVHDAAKSSFLWPAQRTDGTSSAVDAIPAGAHLRLDPSLDLSSISMVPLVRMIAAAAQRYGIIVRDRTLSTNVFPAAQPAPGQVDPITPLLGGTTPAKALAAFPWSRLQVLDAPTCSAWGACRAAESVTISVDTAAPQVGQPVGLDTRNSVLDQPRADVEWDLDGDGTYETDANRATGYSWVPSAPGTVAVGARITTRDGTIVTGTRTVQVAAAPATTVLRPNAVSTTWFYSGSSTYSALAAVSEPVTSPATPTQYRKLYTSSATGSATIDFGSTGRGALAGGSLKAYVDCSLVRCMRLRALDDTGAVVAQADPAFATKGWVTLTLPALSSAQVDGLRLKVTATTSGSGGGTTSIAAVQAPIAS